MVVNIDTDYSELMSAYFCSEGCVAVIDNDGRLVGLYGKKENDNLMGRIIAERSGEININEVINKNYSPIVYSNDVQSQVYDFFENCRFRYVPIVSLNGEFIKFEYNTSLMETMNEKDVLKKRIANRWRIYDKSGQDFKDYAFKCTICNTEIRTSTAEKKISSCIFGGGRLVRYVCPNCGGIIGPLKVLTLSSDDLAEDYRQHYLVFQEGDTTQDEIVTFYHLTPQKGKRYLNYGCGGEWSQSIKILRQQGFDVYGYEPFSNNSSSEYIITDRSILGSMKFDGIFSNNLIEHLVDPINELLFMRSLLRTDNSVMAHSTGCYEYRYVYTRFHICFPVGKSADIMYKKAGLTPYRREETYLHNDRYICVVLRKS